MAFAHQKQTQEVDEQGRAEIAKGVNLRDDRESISLATCFLFLWFIRGY